VCWICLDGAGAQELARPCRCPRLVHKQCLARWQLQSAGTERESRCEFCRSLLPNWREVLTPTGVSGVAPAVMSVNFGGRTFSFEVRPGRSGYETFTESIRRAFALPEDSDLNITFTCDEPSSGSPVTLKGPGAYDAAVHCACVAAEKRTQGQGCPRDLATSAPLSLAQPLRRGRGACDPSAPGSPAATSLHLPVLPGGRGAPPATCPSRHSAGVNFPESDGGTGLWQPRHRSEEAARSGPIRTRGGLQRGPWRGPSLAPPRAPHGPERPSSPPPNAAPGAVSRSWGGGRQLRNNLLLESDMIHPDLVPHPLPTDLASAASSLGSGHYYQGGSSAEPRAGVVPTFALGQRQQFRRLTSELGELGQPVGQDEGPPPALAARRSAQAPRAPYSRESEPGLDCTKEGRSNQRRPSLGRRLRSALADVLGI